LTNISILKERRQKKVINHKPTPVILSKHCRQQFKPSPMANGLASRRNHTAAIYSTNQKHSSLRAFCRGKSNTKFQDNFSRMQHSGTIQKPK
jgi:hypothetical protein